MWLQGCTQNKILRWLVRQGTQGGVWGQHLVFLTHLGAITCFPPVQLGLCKAQRKDVSVCWLVLITDW